MNSLKNREQAAARWKKALTYVVIVGIAFVCALNYQLFVFPNRFAPAGLNGICTIIQYVTGISVGYMSLLINIPLALLVFFLVSRPLAVRSMVYVVAFSVGLLVLDHVDLSQFAYATDNGTSAILGPLVGGIIYGACYSLLLRGSAYAGGTDFVAALIHKRNPNQSVIGLIFTMNAMVAVLSYFVYDYQVEPVILCILYSFTSTTISDRFLKNGRSAVRMEIVTDHPKELSDAIIQQLHHSTTLVPAKGMYSGRETSILVCVVNRSQVAALCAIVHSFPQTFAVMSQVSEVVGNFKRLDTHGHLERDFLDHGTGNVV